MEAERSRLETESDIPSNRRRRGFAQAVTSELHRFSDDYDNHRLKWTVSRHWTEYGD